MKLLYIICFSLIFNACGSAKETATMISGTYEISTIDGLTTLPSKLTMEFNDENKMVSGFAGCNRFTGNYKTSDKKLNFGPLATTKKLCPGEGMKVEDHFLKLLDQVKNYEFKNNTLYLKDEDNKTLIIANQIKVSNQKTMTQNPYILEYSATTRGSFLKVTLNDNSISYQKTRGGLPSSKELNLEALSSILEKANKLELEELKNLEVPSKDHQFDGALLATLKITKNGETFQTPAFDHGNPPEEIADLVNEMLSFVEKP
ncbi:META domain-containing protein [Mangrovimonas futianensis]|uniref:META domain-containing protein n=1 Tax=Mangrovimonas futianensis TaxID=2895523 RepID=UPI001E4ADCD7|nr:META domain-containing protein [Mangrovimonas futianensis]MCF1420647.1 META domain-containing protein [Mangrovimonas futianensis]